MPLLDLPDGLVVTGEIGDRYDEVLSRQALELLAALHRQFGRRRVELLAARDRRQAAFDRGELPAFLDETRAVREEPWSVAPPVPGLQDRQVEITGPTDAKMTINALNSGAKVWLADFEDANTPSWANMVEGQRNLVDAVGGRLTFRSAEGKDYAVGDNAAVIVPRPRGWHLVERHVECDGRPVSASLFDFALYMSGCGRTQLSRGLGPYFYLPKIESHLEARLWNDVFTHAEDACGMAKGSVRATVLIETIPAAFEMDEILFELREHSAGLNAGRWDYLFSMIKKFRNLGERFILPDRNSITMDAPFMRAYSDLLVATCHKRGAHAIGGMAAFIPSRRDVDANERAFAKVREDKEREASAGFDGSWVAHPALVPLCQEIFAAALLGQPNQLSRQRDDVVPDASALLDLRIEGAECTPDGLRSNVRVCLEYLSAWIGGSGAVAINNLMEDVATAEIARSQVWQWLHNEVVLGEGTEVTSSLVRELIEDEARALAERLGEKAVDQARDLFDRMTFDKGFVDFLTLRGYDLVP